MKRIKLLIEYDGTNYAGWQRQKNALSVQELLEENVFVVTGERAAVIGAGRTDSGVHARMQVAHFDTSSAVPPEKFCYALNTGLPRDIRVYESCEVPPEFHARFSASRKHYRYTINNSLHGSAIDGRTQLHVHSRLDFDEMQKAAEFFKGEYDFSSFVASGAQTKDSVRKVHSSLLSRHGDLIHYDIEGNGFLYNMVRIIVGTLIFVGEGKFKAKDIPAIIEKRQRDAAGPTAPACGLMLMRVDYS